MKYHTFIDNNYWFLLITILVYNKFNLINIYSNKHFYLFYSRKRTHTIRMVLTMTWLQGILLYLHASVKKLIFNRGTTPIRLTKITFVTISAVLRYVRFDDNHVLFYIKNDIYMAHENTNLYYTSYREHITWTSWANKITLQFYINTPRYCPWYTLK